MHLYQKYIIALLGVCVVCIAVMLMFLVIPANKKIDRQSIETINNVILLTMKRYEEIFDNVKNTSYSFLVFEDLYTLLTQNNTQEFVNDYTSKLAEFRMFLLHLQKDSIIYSISIYDLNGEILININNAIYDNNISYWMDIAHEKGGRPVWSKTYTAYEFKDIREDISVISLYRAINDPNTFLQVGLMRLSLTEEMLYNVISSSIMTEDELSFFLCDGEGIVISAKDKSIIGSSLQFLQPDSFSSADSMTYSKTIDGDKKYNVSKIPKYDIYLVTLADSDFLQRSSSELVYLTYYIIIALLIFVLSIIIFSSKYIIKPLKMLSIKMHEVELGNLDIQAEVKSNDEVGLLTKTFNNMTKSLKILMENLTNAKLKESEMKIQSLQMQINPHFFLNTLDNIRWIARKNGDSEAEHYIETLSKMMRNNLYNKSPIIKIVDEIENVKVYVTLQQKRFGERIKYIVEVSQDIYNYTILSFVLQPLIENAIDHGFANMNGECLIILSIEKIGDDLVIKVTDNGMGTDEEFVRAIITGEVDYHKISALKNIHDRIELYFGKGYHGGVSIHSTPALGTQVIVIMPANKEQYFKIAK